MRVALAIFLVVVGTASMGWALFSVMGWHGLQLLGGAMVAAVGLLAIPVDRSNR